MRDAAKVLSRGVPAVVIVSQPFLREAESQARKLGVPELPLIVIPRSFGNLRLHEVDAEIDAAAEIAVEGLLALSR